MSIDTVVLDCESTGLNNGLALDEPVQIAITDLRGNPVFTTLLRPTSPIPDEAAAIHGITNEMVKGAPSFADVLPEFCRVIRDKTIAIYNAAFDVRLLITAAHVHQVILPRFDYRCVMLEYAAAFGKAHPTRTGEYKWWSLGTAYEQQFAMTQTTLEMLAGAHDALADCRMTADLMWLMDMHGLEKTCSDTFDVVLMKAQAKRDRNGNGYLSFTTAGGQMVNVFNGRGGEGFGRFRDAGYDAAQMVAALMTRDADYVHTLKNPIAAQMRYSGDYAEIVGVVDVMEGVA